MFSISVLSWCFVMSDLVCVIVFSVSCGLFVCVWMCVFVIRNIVRFIGWILLLWIEIVLLIVLMVFCGRFIVRSVSVRLY